MTAIDIGFAVVAGLGTLTLLLCSPWHRAVVKECLLHPRSDGWVDIDAGRVHVHRGSRLRGHEPLQTSASLHEAQTRPEAEAGGRQSQPAGAPGQAKMESIKVPAVAGADTPAGATGLLEPGGHQPSVGRRT